MSEHYSLIDNSTINEKTQFLTVHSLPEIINLNDPAKEMLTDFHYQRPATISIHASITEAMLEMKASNVHLLFVLNPKDEIVGLISSQALHGEKPYIIMQEKRIKHNEVTVDMLMLPLAKVLCLTQEHIKFSKIGDLIETFKHHKRYYALVVCEKEHQVQEICGYFSILQISKKLGFQIDPKNSEQTESVAKLQKMLSSFS